MDLAVGVEVYGKPYTVDPYANLVASYSRDHTEITTKEARFVELLTYLRY